MDFSPCRMTLSDDERKKEEREESKEGLREEEMELVLVPTLPTDPPPPSSSRWYATLIYDPNMWPTGQDDITWHLRQQRLISRLVLDTACAFAGFCRSVSPMFRSGDFPSSKSHSLSLRHRRHHHFSVYCSAAHLTTCFPNSSIIREAGRGRKRAGGVLAPKTEMRPNNSLASGPRRAGGRERETRRRATD